MLPRSNLTDPLSLSARHQGPQTVDQAQVRMRSCMAQNMNPGGSLGQLLKDPRRRIAGIEPNRHGCGNMTALAHIAFDEFL